VRERADKVRRLLQTLGDTNDQLSLNKRFKHMNRCLQAHKLDQDAAETYADLTLAVHDLNLLLADAFYPGSERQPSKRRPGRTAVAVAGVTLALTAAPLSLKADQVEMQSGDRYNGHVVSINTNTVVIQSDALGTLRVPRSKVANITLSPVPTAASPALPSASKAQAAPSSGQAKATAPKASPMFSGLDTNSFLVQQVQKQFLSDAGGEANAKFNELLGGLMSGKLDMEDIRAQAKVAAGQLRALQRESGEETGLATGTYLAILDHFLEETEPATSTTNKAERAPAPKASVGSQNE